MQNNIQHTAVQRAIQPVASYIKPGLEQFDIYDTDGAIQQQEDGNTAELNYLQLLQKKTTLSQEDAFISILSQG